MEFSHLLSIKLSEQEAKDIVAKHINEQGEYFVYSHDIDFVLLASGKIEVVIKNATSRVPKGDESGPLPYWA